MRIIVDVMGGDNAPREMVLGVLAAAEKRRGRRNSYEQNLFHNNHYLKQLITFQTF